MNLIALLEWNPVSSQRDTIFTAALDDCKRIYGAADASGDAKWRCDEEKLVDVVFR